MDYFKLYIFYLFLFGNKLKKLINLMYYYNSIYNIIPVMSRKELLSELKIETVNDIPDEYLKVLIEYHRRIDSINKKELLLISFINYVFEKNGASPITKLSEFTNVYRDKLLFTTIPEKMRDDIKNAYKIIIREEKNSENCASLYIKNMVKQLPAYTFDSSRKDILFVVDGVKKKKPMMVYYIFNN